MGTDLKTVVILLNNGNGTFAAAVNYGAGSVSWSVFSADLDGDNNNDLAVANRHHGYVSILLDLTNTLHLRRRERQRR